MNLRSLGVLAVLVFALGAAGPVAHAGTVAACGTTQDQWAGTFEGTKSNGEPFGDATLLVRISQGSAGPAVRTTVNGSEYAQYGPATIPGGTILWVTRTVALPFAIYSTFDSTGVTCSGDRVVAFSGVVTVRGEWIGPFANAADVTPFSVGRTA